MIAIIQSNDSAKYSLLRRGRNNRGVYRWRYIVDDVEKHYVGEPFMLEQDPEPALVSNEQPK
jgi:hypothetical protein